MWSAILISPGYFRTCLNSNRGNAELELANVDLHLFARATQGGTSSGGGSGCLRMLGTMGRRNLTGSSSSSRACRFEGNSGHQLRVLVTGQDTTTTRNRQDLTVPFEIHSIKHLIR